MKLKVLEENRKTKSNIIKLPLSDISISHFGYEKTAIFKKSVDAKAYPAFRIHFVVDGVVELLYNGEKYKMKKNTCFIVRPDCECIFTENKDKSASYYWVAFNGRLVHELLSKMGFSDDNPCVIVSSQYRKELGDAFFQSLQDKSDDFGGLEFEFLECFFRIVKLLCLNSSTSDLKPFDGGSNVVKEALKYFNEHYTEEGFTLKAVAEHIYVHENYLSSIFKATVGVSFKQYMNQRRVDLALSLIQQNYTSVNEISQMVGFSDASYFTKVFKKFNRISPSEEIRKIKSKKQRIKEEKR